jgi:hypothetical protein
MRDERGEMTVAHMLVAMTVMLMVIGATLTVFTGAERLNREAGERTADQEAARTGIEELAAQLRNLASPTNDQPQAIDVAGAYDLVFQTVDRIGPNTGLNAANVMRVRYCLGTTDATRLYRQEQRWTSQATPTAPSVTSCPGAASTIGWSVTTQVAASVVNRRNGLNRPLFTYNATSATDISAVHIQAWVDRDITSAPTETPLSTGVFLRNQNRKPVVGFTADTTVYGKVVLNGALSVDPEGDPLTYVWYDGAVKVGEGVRFDYSVTPGTSHAIQLKVFDLAGLQGDSTIQTVEAPGL